MSQGDQQVMRRAVQFVSCHFFLQTLFSAGFLELASVELREIKTFGAKLLEICALLNYIDFLADSSNLSVSVNL